MIIYNLIILLNHFFVESFDHATNANIRIIVSLLQRFAFLKKKNHIYKQGESIGKKKGKRSKKTII